MFNSLQTVLFAILFAIILLTFFFAKLFPVSSVAVIAFAVLISAFATVVFSALFLRPIRRMAESLANFSKDKTPVTIMRKSPFEIGHLESAIEGMSKDLYQNFQKLTLDRDQNSAILSSMTEGVLAVDKWGRVILANPSVEKMFNVIEPEILGKLVREAIRNNEIADLIESAMDSNVLITKEINIIIPVEFSFITHAGPIKSSTGEFMGAVCVLYDITELRKLERFRSEFVANVSHELKTPLTAIRGYVDTLVGGAIDDKDHNREFLSKIEKHTINLSTLIDDILEISRLESGKELGAFVNVDIVKVIDRAMDLVKEKAARKRITVNGKCAGGLFVIGMEDHVFRAILNLLDNAVNYTNEGGKVDVSCLKTGEKILVFVSDTGIGIPKEHLPRIFERFYRVDKARSRDLGGTGLGLAIVKHVMNVHNGSVSVESEEGKGSKFTLAFPA